MALGVAAQPFLAGSGLTGQNAGRLATLGLLPLVIAWAMAGKKELGARATLVIAGILFVTSTLELLTWWLRQ